MKNINSKVLDLVEYCNFDIKNVSIRDSLNNSKIRLKIKELRTNIWFKIVLNEKRLLTSTSVQKCARGVSLINLF